MLMIDLVNIILDELARRNRVGSQPSLRSRNYGRARAVIALIENGFILLIRKF